METLTVFRTFPGFLTRDEFNVISFEVCKVFLSIHLVFFYNRSSVISSFVNFLRKRTPKSSHGDTYVTECHTRKQLPQQL